MHLSPAPTAAPCRRRMFGLCGSSQQPAVGAPGISRAVAAECSSGERSKGSIAASLDDHRGGLRRQRLVWLHAGGQGGALRRSMMAFRHSGVSPNPSRSSDGAWIVRCSVHIVRSLGRRACHKPSSGKNSATRASSREYGVFCRFRLVARLRHVSKLTPRLATLSPVVGLSQGRMPTQGYGRLHPRRRAVHVRRTTMAAAPAPTQPGIDPQVATA